MPLGINWPVVLPNTVPWPIGALIAYAIVRHWRPEWPAITRGWSPLVQLRWRFLGWVALTGLTAQSIRTVWTRLSALQGWMGILNSGQQLEYHPYELFTYIIDYAVYPVVWLVAVLVLMRTLARANPNQLLAAVGWEGGRWSQMLLSLALVLFVVWPLDLPTQLVEPIRAFNGLRDVETDTGLPAGLTSILPWLRQLYALAPLIGLLVGLGAARHVMRQLERLARLPTLSGHGTRGMWLILIGTVSDGVTNAVQLGANLIRDGAGILARAVGGMPGLAAQEAAHLTTWIVWGHALPLLALLMAVGALIVIDWEQVAARTGFRLGRVPTLAWLSLGAWLTWPFRLPFGVTKAAPLLAPLGATSVELVAISEVLLIALWLAYVAVLDRPRI